jgi:hypothetical protein
MARAQFSMRRAALLEASLFTTSINQAWADPRIRMEPELKTNISVSVEQNRGLSPAPDSRLRYIKGLQRESETLFRNDERRRNGAGRFLVRGTGLGPAAVAGPDLVRAEMR